MFKKRSTGHGSKATLMQNTVMLYILTFSNYFLGLIVAPYETRVLGPQVYGTLGAATAVMVYFQLFIDFGFLLSGTQEVAVHRSNTTQLRRIFTAVTSAKLILTAISVVLLVIACNVIPAWEGRLGFFFLFFLGTAANSMIPDYLYRGMERMSAITLRTVCIKVFFTVGILLFLKTPEDVWKVPAITALGNFIAMGYSYYDLHRRFGIRFCRISWRDVADTVKRSAVFFYSRIATTAYSALNTVILDMISASGAPTSFYTSADKLITTGKSALTPISDSLYPYMVKHRDFKLAKKVLLVLEPLIVVFCGIFFIWAEPLCALIFGADFAPAGHSAQLYSGLSHDVRHGHRPARQLLGDLRLVYADGESVGAVPHREHQHGHAGYYRFHYGDADLALPDRGYLAAPGSAAEGERLMGLRDFASEAMWRLCGLLPIDRKKVVFSSYYGRGY